MVKKKHKPQPPTEYVEVEVNHGIFDDYLQYGPQVGKRRISLEGFDRQVLAGARRAGL